MFFHKFYVQVHFRFRQLSVDNNNNNNTKGKIYYNGDGVADWVDFCIFYLLPVTNCIDYITVWRHGNGGCCLISLFLIPAQWS